MAIKHYETGTRFNPDLYTITLAEVNTDTDTNRIAVGVEVKMGSDTIKLQSAGPLSLSEFVPVTDFGFQNYD